MVTSLSKMYKDGEFDKSGSKKVIKEELLLKNIPGIVPIYEIDSNSDSMYSVVVDTSLKINLPLVGQTPVPVPVQGPQVPIIVKPTGDLSEMYKIGRKNYVDISKSVDTTKSDYSKIAPKNRQAIPSSNTAVNLNAYKNSKPNNYKVPSAKLGYTKEETDKTKISYDIRLKEEGIQSMGAQPKGPNETWQQLKESKSNIKNTGELGIQQVIGVESTIKNK